MTSVLFVTSNGTGLGHLTRCMAIARRLPDGVKPLVFTLSKALRPVRGQGFYVEYFPSRRAAHLPGGQWNARLAARLSSLLEEYRPAVVAFDGTFPYRGLRLAIAEHQGPAYVWIRRPMWQPDVDPEPLSYSEYFDRIIEPGEFAAPADVGPTVERRGEAVLVDPITFCDRGELLPREQAQLELGLEPGRAHALIQLGEVPSYERDFLMQSCVSQILRDSETQVAILESAISERFVVPRIVVKVSATYPIARLYRAFDFVISAAGYNSYHELIGFQIPTAFFPVRKPTDNQPARARYAAEVGVGVEAGLEPSAAIEALLSESKRGQMSAKALELSFANGGVAAAQEIARLAREGSPERDAARSRRLATRAASVEPNSGGDAAIALSTASIEDLLQVKGIGPATARKIIEFRDRRGGLSSVGELEDVPGVGSETIRRLLARVRP